MAGEDDENAALLSAVLATAIDAIITIDHRGIIQHANHAVSSLFGYEPDEVIGKNVSMLMPEPDRSQHDQYIGDYRRTKKGGIIGVGREVLGQRKDGSLIPVDLAVTEVEVGGRVLFTGILRDMTKRNETEANLRSVEQKMIQSERLAAIGQMMMGLAHESRNALQRSRACLDILDLELEGHPEQRHLVQRTRSAILELQNLYEEVRNYAVPIALERLTQPLNEIAAETWSHLQDELHPLEFRLEIQAAKALPCRVDRFRIGQVFRNLFENAIAASPPGTTIRMNFHLVDRGGERHLAIHVLDQGSGVASADREKVFEPFYTTKTKGTGLGLAICRRIIEAHGGKIYAGDPPTGAEIIIELPVD